jgi:hypothetical protein
MANKDIQSMQKTVAALVKGLAGRNKDIISRRFGLQNGKKETLESIGRSYGITRERVRQIEEFTLGQLTKASVNFKEIEKYVSSAHAILSKEGGIMKERSLFKEYTGNEKDSTANAALVFLLTLNKEFVRFNENDHAYSFWAVDQNHMDAFKGAISTLITALDKKKQVVPSPELVSFARANNVPGVGSVDLNDKTLSTILTICKDLDTNIFGEVGLVTWAEVKPKGVRDKAYLIMKKQGAPRHFGDIAKLINVSNFGDDKKVNIQTVHNELIKDNRFVLVGRGMYALSEWGYKSGTVKDVLMDIIKTSSKPLTKTELVAKVMDARMVKENTILLNLQDSKSFVKKDDGTYTLRKA